MHGFPIAGVGRTKQKPVHVVMTLKRPVPLEHYILAKGKVPRGVLRNCRCIDTA